MIKPGVFHFPKCLIGPRGLNGVMFLGAQIERKGKERKGKGQGKARVLWSYSSTAVLAFKGTSGDCLLTLGTIFLSPGIIFPAGQDP